MRAALYARVSTRTQAQEGTSLESQVAAALSLAREKGLEVPPEFVFREDWSGATLDRPLLEKVRELVRAREVGAIIAYATDRLSRNPIHVALLAEECERHEVDLLFVTEPLDNSREGQLILYVKGYAAALERERIADRTIRGRRARARAGKIPAGCGVGLYGYRYIPEEGRRAIVEDQAEVVRMIYRWLVEEQASLYTICVRLNERKIPPPKGGARWGLSTVARLLRNEAYCGRTIAFKHLSVEPRNARNHNKRYAKVARQLRPEEEWVELPPGVTPAIIDRDLFLAAGAQLRKNFERAQRNQKHQYLLSGHIRCGFCGRRYNGHLNSNARYAYRQYRCAGKSRAETLTPCPSHAVKADQIEELVWAEVKRVLLNPGLVLRELHRRKEEAGRRSTVEEQLESLTRQLESLTRKEQRLVRLYSYGEIDDELLDEEVKTLSGERGRLKEEQARLRGVLQAQVVTDAQVVTIEEYCRRVAVNIDALSFVEKRLALDALQIRATVVPDGVSIEGAIPADADIASPSSR